MSRMPTRDIWSVLGIGVAERVKTSTLDVVRLIRSLSSTPNFCSSSMINSPRLKNFTSLEASRCVPMTISTCPLASFLSVSFCSAVVSKRLSLAISKGNSAMRRRNVL